jgi:arylformamidase
MKIIDISPVISEKTAVWPGDHAFNREISRSIDGGDNYTLSSIHTTVHVGAHTDAPSHYLKGGAAISEVSLESYIGHCQVLEINIEKNSRILISDLTEEIKAPRVLFKTNSDVDKNTFTEDFNALSVELVKYLHECAVKLIGIDTPSVDLFDCEDLLAHNQIAQSNMAILEGVDLQNVKAGLYDLVALPLKIAHCDASPVRAVLLSPSSA